MYNFTCSMISSSLERRIAAIRSNGSLVILRTRLKTIIWERGTNEEHVEEKQQSSNLAPTEPVLKNQHRLTHDDMVGNT